MVIMTNTSILFEMNVLIIVVKKITGSYLYSLQIRPRPNVKLIKWNLYDFIPEPNVFKKDVGYFVMVTHGLEAPPLQLHMEFAVNTWNFSFQ